MYGRRKSKEQMLWMKRFILNPRAYLTPFVITVITHHLPMILAFFLIERRQINEECDELKLLFRWLYVAFGLHAVTLVLTLVDIVTTLVMTVYRKRRPENWLILSIFLFYVMIWGWAIGGEIEFAPDVPQCEETVVPEDLLFDTAHMITYLQHFDLVYTSVCLGLFSMASYLCGTHHTKDISDIEMRWEKRVLWFLRACTCRSFAEEEEENVFKSLGILLGKVFVVRYNNDQKYEGLQINDLMFSLNLVAKQHNEERKSIRLLPKENKRFGLYEEEEQLNDIAFYGKLSIGVYGWVIFLWYNPFHWVNAIQSWIRKRFKTTTKKKNTPNPIVDTTSFVGGQSPGPITHDEEEVEEMIQHATVYTSGMGIENGFRASMPPPISHASSTATTVTNTTIQTAPTTQQSLLEMEEPFSNCSSISYRASSTFVPLSQAQDKDNSPSKDSQHSRSSSSSSSSGGSKKKLHFSSSKTISERPKCRSRSTLDSSIPFVKYSGIKKEALTFFNNANFLFQAPYAIVKDEVRREVIICVRGSLSIYDFITDGLAQIVPLEQEENPFSFSTYTHDGILRTARGILVDLQYGQARESFWEFAVNMCETTCTTITSSSLYVPEDSGVPNNVSSLSLGRTEQLYQYTQESNQTPWRIVICGHSLGAGVGGVLALLLKRFFPATRAFLYAPPSLFDPMTAACCKSFMTTIVYGDDIVPRLSIANMFRLREEMSKEFNRVANKRLFHVKYWKKNKKSSHTTHETAERNEAPLVPSNDDGSELMEEMVLDLNFYRDLEDPQLDVDLPGRIVHVTTVKQARRCGCRMLCGQEELEYSIREPDFFKRVWITPRAVRDHMYHHYDHNLQYLFRHRGKLPDANIESND